MTIQPSGKTRGIGPYSRPSALRALDQRTKEARLLRETVADLTGHVGGAPSAVERMLIQRAASLTLRLAQLDAKDVLTDHDQRAYSAWGNHLRLTLRELGLKPKAAPARTLQQHIAEKLAERVEGTAL